MPSEPGRAEALADRLAASLVPRDPGCRLPRRGVLARKLTARLDDLDIAVGDLVSRALIRRLPDGQLYRASPPGQWIPVEGPAWLATRLDPMGNTIDCQLRQAGRHKAPPEVASALGLAPGTEIGTIRTVWAVDGVPGAEATAYQRDADVPPAAEADGGCAAGARPPLAVTAARVEVGPAGRETALGLGPGQLAVTVTARFAEPATRTTSGVAVVTLRAELFRIAVEVTAQRRHAGWPHDTIMGQDGSVLAHDDECGRVRPLPRPW